MKICIIEDFYKPYSSGGASEYVMRLVESLVKAGHDVSVITTSPDSTKSYSFETLEGVRVFRVPTHLVNIPIYSKKISSLGRLPSALLYWFNPWVYRTVKKILLELRPDVVHSFDTLYLSLGALAAVRQSRIPWAHSLLYVNLVKPTGLIWTPDSKQGIGAWNLMLPFTRWLVKTPNVVITPSKFSLGIHQQYGLFRKAHTVLIPLGPMHEIPSLARHSSLPRKFLTVGRMNSEKGIINILQAFIAYPNPSIRLTIVGRGPDESAIRALAATDSRVEVLSHLSSEDLGQLFSQSDVYISASRALETFNLTISEAFQAGMPVITTDLGAQPELVGTDCGLVYPPGDQVALTKAIRRYLDEPGLWAHHAARAKERSKDYSFTTNLRETLRAYSELVTAKT